MKTILATAYAVNPYKGSEDGMGWNFILQIARFNNVIAITRENNREHIEKYMLEHTNLAYQRITFLYYDLPYWMRFWKKGSRGAMLYFWMWQCAIPIFVRKQKLSYDIVHNINFHNDWTPSYLWKLKKPFVWGPIGHHPLIPSSFLKPYDVRYWMKDRLAWAVKKMFWSLSPGLQNTRRHASHILCMNSQVKKAIGITSESHSIMPSVATEDFGIDVLPSQKKFTLISAGRLVPLKGFDLTIQSFVKFIGSLPELEKINCELIIVGSGPEEKFLRNLVDQNNATRYVRFINWIERQELMKLYEQSSVFLFPSHEGAGMVVAEAMSFGLPVICLANSGPGEFIDQSSGIAIASVSREEAIERIFHAIEVLYRNPDKLSVLKRGARRRFESYFHWDRRGEQLEKIYNNLSV